MLRFFTNKASKYAFLWLFTNVQKRKIHDSTYTRGELVDRG